LERDIHVEESDYGKNSVKAILDANGASTLVSFLQAADTLYLNLHRAWLAACIESKSCKRFIPSEWAGNVDDYPQLPKFYADSRVPFRHVLQQTAGIEWTLFNCGWLMDYFLPQRLTRMTPEPENFPIDPNAWRACIRGSGNEMQSWTWSKDVAAAICELLAAPSWVCNNFTYMSKTRV
jgi:swainsonine biosynthesis oxidoreductase SwnR